MCLYVHSRAIRVYVMCLYVHSRAIRVYVMCLYVHSRAIRVYVMCLYVNSRAIRVYVMCLYVHSRAIREDVEIFKTQNGRNFSFVFPAVKVSNLQIKGALQQILMRRLKAESQVILGNSISKAEKYVCSRRFSLQFRGRATKLQIRLDYLRGHVALHENSTQ